MPGFLLHLTRTMASSTPQVTLAWIALPPAGLLDPHTTALLILHKAFPLAAIRFERLVRPQSGRFILLARGDGVDAICTLPALNAWTFEKEDAPTSESFAPSATDAAGNGSYDGGDTKASKSSTSDDSSAADAKPDCSAAANLKVSEPFVKVASINTHCLFADFTGFSEGSCVFRRCSGSAKLCRCTAGGPGGCCLCKHPDVGDRGRSRSCLPRC